MASEADEATLAAYADAQARFEVAGGYRWRDAARETVRGLGFGRTDLDRDLSTFSGGELTRASLARALAAKPDLLLLDEPTNHLDIASLEWLERAADRDGRRGDPRGSRPMVPGVRRQLGARAGRGAPRSSSPARGTNGGSRRRGASSSSSATQSAARRTSPAWSGSSSAFAPRTRWRRGRSRSRSRSTASSATRRSATRRPSKSLAFSFGEAQRSGKVVLAMEGATIDAGSKRLFEDAEMWVEAGEHVCLIGHNGSGKSTLISVLVGEREPVSGRVKVGHNVELGHLRQHAEVPADPGLTRPRARAALDRPLRGEDPRPARAVPLLGRRRHEARHPAVRRRGAAALARAPRLVGFQRPHPRRADQPPGPREPRGARGRPGPVHRLAPPRLARPRDARGCRHPHRRGRGPQAPRLQRRLVGVPRARSRTGRARARRGRQTQARCLWHR